MPDCLICFQPLRRRAWKPNLPCDCRPTLHKSCWEEWTRHTGHPTCVICRSLPVAPPLPLPHAILLIAREPNHARQPPPWWRDIESITALLGVIVLFWIIIVMSIIPPHVTIYVPPQERAPWNPYRDEL